MLDACCHLLGGGAGGAVINTGGGLSIKEGGCVNRTWKSVIFVGKVLAKPDG